MYKSCCYCGKIHDVNYECPQKPKREYKSNEYSEANAEIKKFRNSHRWQIKRAEIQSRDIMLCQVCIRLLYDWCTLQYNYEDTSVHHIIKLQDDFSRRLDNYNLLTLCSCCHTAADLGQIPIKVLLEIAKEQEEKGKYKRVY